MTSDEGSADDCGCDHLLLTFRGLHQPPGARAGRHTPRAAWRVHQQRSNRAIQRQRGRGTGSGGLAGHIVSLKNRCIMIRILILIDVLHRTFCEKLALTQVITTRVSWHRVSHCCCLCAQIHSPDSTPRLASARPAVYCVTTETTAATKVAGRTCAGARRQVRTVLAIHCGEAVILPFPGTCSRDILS